MIKYFELGQERAEQSTERITRGFQSCWMINRSKTVIIFALIAPPLIRFNKPCCCFVRRMWAERWMCFYKQRLTVLSCEEENIKLTAASSSLLSLVSSLLWCPAEERASRFRLASVPSVCLSPSRPKDRKKSRPCSNSKQAPLSSQLSLSSLTPQSSSPSSF